MRPFAEAPEPPKKCSHLVPFRSKFAASLSSEERNVHSCASGMRTALCKGCLIKLQIDRPGGKRQWPFPRELLCVFQ